MDRPNRVQLVERNEQYRRLGQLAAFSGRILGAESGLNSRATLPADRCHLDGAAVGVNRHDGDDAAIQEKYTVERTIGI